LAILLIADQLAENASASFDKMYKCIGGWNHLKQLAEGLKSLPEGELRKRIFVILDSDEVGANAVFTELCKQGFSTSVAKGLVQDAQDDVRIARFQKRLNPPILTLSPRIALRLVLLGIALLLVLFSLVLFVASHDLDLAAISSLLTNPSFWLHGCGEGEFNVVFAVIALLAFLRLLNNRFRSSLALHRYKRYLRTSQGAQMSVE
jgi:hypothetical protein